MNIADKRENADAFLLSRLNGRTGGPAVRSCAGFCFDEGALMVQRRILAGTFSFPGRLVHPVGRGNFVPSYCPRYN